MWAHDQSSNPNQQGFHNVPDIRSPALGLVSTIVAMALNVVAVTSTITMFILGVRMRDWRGRTSIRGLNDPVRPFAVAAAALNS